MGFLLPTLGGGGLGSEQAHRHQGREVFAQPANAHSRLFSLPGQAGGEDVSNPQCRKDCNTIFIGVQLLTTYFDVEETLVLRVSYPEIFIIRTGGDLYSEPGFEL